VIAPKTARRLGVLLLAFVLVGCGGPSAPSTAPSAAGGEHNDADVAFARMMLQHGQEGAAMADLAAKRATRADVARLATDLRAAQEPEADRLTGYLDEWGAGATAVPAEAPDHGDRAMYDPVAELGNASGDQFDTLFLQLMIAHHQSGVEAARKEVSDGRNPGVTQLAAAVVQDQGGEIDRMQQLINKG
jgi:uncharacterized protein (DUF305 family)